MENDLYRIAQEALNNALKHADATDVTVTLRDKNEVIELEITDNGKGFDVEAAQAQGGMGMDNIRERAQLLGGTCAITSQPGEGARVLITVPVVKSP